MRPTANLAFHSPAFSSRSRIAITSSGVAACILLGAAAFLGIIAPSIGFGESSAPWNWEMFCNSHHSGGYVTPMHSDHQVNVGVAVLHIADETLHTVVLVRKS
jgi:hypothetical protein